jgi:hypothetical protein
MASGESHAVQPFEPLRGRATWTKRLLWAVVATSGLAAISDLQQRQQPETDSSFYAFMGGVQLLLLFATAIVFIRWLRQAYANLPALGVAQRFRPFWVIVGWFVPFLNLFRPKQIVDDTWKAGNQPSLTAPTSFNLWWAAFIASNIISNFAARSSWSAETTSDVKFGATVYLITDVIDVIAALLALNVVETVTASQERTAATKAAAPAPAV